MKVLQEITDWSTSYRSPNHTYLVESNKLIAYKKWHTGEPVFFDHRARFDRARRKFAELPYRAEDWNNLAAKTNTIRVAGSQGNTYEVDPELGTCTCPGY